MCVVNTNKQTQRIKMDHYKEATSEYNTILDIMSDKGERLPSELAVPPLGFMMYELKK
jgi:hypothetical protein